MIVDSMAPKNYVKGHRCFVTLQKFKLKTQLIRAETKKENFIRGKVEVLDELK